MDLGNVKPLPWALPCNGPSEILVPPSRSSGGQRLMIKHILIAVTTALLVLPNLPSTILADPPEVPNDAGTHRPQFSAEDFDFTDARIAALKSGLQLKPTQEKKWFA